MRLIRSIGRLLALSLLLGALPARGQYINQTELEEVLSIRTEDLDSLPDVQYEYYVLYSSRNNSVIARNTFYSIIGEGDVERGRKRARLVGLLNRVLVERAEVGDTLVIPTVWDLDLRAYSPFPRYYAGARDLDKIFIIDKTIQAWAAYEYGRLERWGIVNTGDPSQTPTPNGRFNFNWKTEYRISSLSPPGEPWEMYWVVNFHDARGIHVHQYPMPTGGPTSHGCVRLVDYDARWIYNWADTWTTTRGDGFGSSQGRIIKQGTMVLVIGEDPTDHPHPFLYKEKYPVLQRVELPENPYDVPPGTPQQEYFDKLRGLTSDD